MNSIVFLYAAAIKATVILSAAGLLSVALRRTTSSARYFLWTCALASVLAIPLMSLLVRWDVPLATVPVAAASPELSDVAVGAPAPDPPSAPARPWVATIWLCGAVLTLARLATGHIRVLLSLRRSRTVRDAEWMRILAEASSRIGLRRQVELRRGRETDIPLSYGFFRPVVLLPHGSCEWSPQRRRVVLMHELVHARRLDSLLYLLAQLSCAAYWFQPLAWVALSRFRQEQERSCDDAVVRAGTGQSEYAEHLVSLARSVSARGQWSAALGMAEVCDLEKRVQALLDPLRNRGGLSRRACVAVLAAVVVCLIPLAAVRAQDSRPNASLAGSVYDPSGAAVPFAVITLKNSDKTHQEITRVGRDGTYKFANIAAGTYNLEAKARGFAVYQQAGVVLQPGTSEQLNLKLDLGQVVENVDVVGKGRQPAEPAGSPQRIRVGGNVQATKLLSSVKPLYPAGAESSGIQGTVLLRAVISTQGTLLGLKVLNTSVDPGLAKAATDAVQQWRYQPTLLNGVPVEVVTTIAVNFRLEQ